MWNSGKSRKQQVTEHSPDIQQFVKRKGNQGSSPLCFWPLCFDGAVWAKTRSFKQPTLQAAVRQAALGGVCSHRRRSAAEAANFDCSKFDSSPTQNLFTRDLDKNAGKKNRNQPCVVSPWFVWIVRTLYKKSCFKWVNTCNCFFEKKTFLVSLTNFTGEVSIRVHPMECLLMECFLWSEFCGVGTLCSASHGVLSTDASSRFRRPKRARIELELSQTRDEVGFGYQVANRSSTEKEVQILLINETLEEPRHCS